MAEEAARSFNGQPMWGGRREEHSSVVQQAIAGTMDGGGYGISVSDFRHYAPKGIMEVLGVVADA